MNTRIAAIAAACSLAFTTSALAQAPAPAPAPTAASAAPAAPPAWKQGMGDKYKDSKLAPNPGKNTETPVSDGALSGVFAARRYASLRKQKLQLPQCLYVLIDQNRVPI